MSKGHTIMVRTSHRVRCSCTLHACPSPPQLGDPLCRFCREHCYKELIRRERRRRHVLMVLGGILVFGVSYLLGHVVGPMLGG